MKNKYYLILFILLFALSCKKGNPTISSFTESSYPLAIGNWWQYQVNQTNEGGGYDTTLLNTVSTAKIGPYIKYTCNITLNGRFIDSGYFLQSDTSLSFINNLPPTYFSLFPNFHLKFPIEIGQYWQGAFSGDSIRVVGLASDCEGSYGQYFSTCFSTVESYNLLHNFKVENMLLTAKVGLVHQSIDFNSDTAQGGIQINQAVNLINYHVQ